MAAVAAGSSVDGAHLDFDAEQSGVGIGKGGFAFVESRGGGLRQQKGDGIGVLAGEDDVGVGEIGADHLVGADSPSGATPPPGARRTAFGATKRRKGQSYSSSARSGRRVVGGLRSTARRSISRTRNW